MSICAGVSFLPEESGGIRKFAPTSGNGGTFPQRLSDTGIFRDLATLSPETGLIPYDVNAPLWSDGARKTRGTGRCRRSDHSP